MIVSVVKSDVGDCPLKKLDCGVALEDKVAVVAKKSSNCACVMAVIDAEHVVPMCGIARLLWRLSTDCAHAILIREQALVVIERNAIPILELGTDPRARILCRRRWTIPAGPLRLPIVAGAKSPARYRLFAPFN